MPSSAFLIPVSPGSHVQESGSGSRLPQSLVDRISQQIDKLDTDTRSVSDKFSGVIRLHEDVGTYLTSGVSESEKLSFIESVFLVGAQPVSGEEKVPASRMGAVSDLGSSELEAGSVATIGKGPSETRTLDPVHSVVSPVRSAIMHVLAYDVLSDGGLVDALAFVRNDPKLGRSFESIPGFYACLKSLADLGVLGDVYNQLLDRIIEFDDSQSTKGAEIRSFVSRADIGKFEQDIEKRRQYHAMFGSAGSGLSDAVDVSMRSPFSKVFSGDQAATKRTLPHLVDPEVTSGSFLDSPRLLVRSPHPITGLTRFGSGVGGEPPVLDMPLMSVPPLDSSDPSPSLSPSSMLYDDDASSSDSSVSSTDRGERRLAYAQLRSDYRTLQDRFQSLHAQYVKLEKLKVEYAGLKAHVSSAVASYQGVMTGAIEQINLRFQKTLSAHAEETEKLAKANAEKDAELCRQAGEIRALMDRLKAPRPTMALPSIGMMSQSVSELDHEAELRIGELEQQIDDLKEENAALRERVAELADVQSDTQILSQVGSFDQASTARVAAKKRRFDATQTLFSEILIGCKVLSAVLKTGAEANEVLEEGTASLSTLCSVLDGYDKIAVALTSLIAMLRQFDEGVLAGRFIRQSELSDEHSSVKDYYALIADYKSLLSDLDSPLFKGYFGSLGHTLTMLKTWMGSVSILEVEDGPSFERLVEGYQSLSMVSSAIKSFSAQWTACTARDARIDDLLADVEATLDTTFKYVADTAATFVKSEMAVFLDYLDEAGEDEAGEEDIPNEALSAWITSDIFRAILVSGVDCVAREVIETRNFADFVLKHYIDDDNLRTTFLGSGVLACFGTDDGPLDLGAHQKLSKGLKTAMTVATGLAGYATFSSPVVKTHLVQQMADGQYKDVNTLVGIRGRTARYRKGLSPITQVSSPPPRSPVESRVLRRRSGGLMGGLMQSIRLKGGTQGLSASSSSGSGGGGASDGPPPAPRMNPALLAAKGPGNSAVPLAPPIISGSASENKQPARGSESSVSTGVPQAPPPAPPRRALATPVSRSSGLRRGAESEAFVSLRESSRAMESVVGAHRRTEITRRRVIAHNRSKAVRNNPSLKRELPPLASTEALVGILNREFDAFIEAINAYFVEKDLKVGAGDVLAPFEERLGMLPSGGVIRTLMGEVVKSSGDLVKELDAVSEKIALYQNFKQLRYGDRNRIKNLVKKSTSSASGVTISGVQAFFDVFATELGKSKDSSTASKIEQWQAFFDPDPLLAKLEDERNQLYSQIFLRLYYQPAFQKNLDEYVRASICSLVKLAPTSGSSSSETDIKSPRLLVAKSEAFESGFGGYLEWADLAYLFGSDVFSEPPDTTKVWKEEILDSVSMLSNYRESNELVHTLLEPLLLTNPDLEDVLGQMVGVLKRVLKDDGKSLADAEYAREYLGTYLAQFPPESGWPAVAAVLRSSPRHFDEFALYFFCRLGNGVQTFLNRLPVGNAKMKADYDIKPYVNQNILMPSQSRSKDLGFWKVLTPIRNETSTDSVLSKYDLLLDRLDQIWKSEDDAMKRVRKVSESAPVGRLVIRLGLLQQFFAHEIQSDPNIVPITPFETALLAGVKTKMASLTEAVSELDADQLGIRFSSVDTHLLGQMIPPIVTETGADPGGTGAPIQEVAVQ